METLSFVVLSFICGAFPFSVWLGKLLLKRDVRLYGDGNPGASNAFRAGNHYVGLLALILDISKAAAPVGWAFHNQGTRGMPMFVIAVAPILGHAYSPFLNFRGGKAIAPALGVWIGLTLWIASLPGVIASLIGIVILTPPGWAVLIALMTILVALVGWLPDPLLLSVWAAQVIILSWKHRVDLSGRPHLRPWIKKVIERG